MTNTLWSDISEFQVPVDDRYPYQFLSFRSNDGTYEDHHFVQNISWARGAVHRGKMFGFMVYYFYRPGVNGASVLMQRVGRPDPKLTVMIDVESAGGAISGNQSAAINAQFHQLANWLGSDHRVTGYGNTGDLNALWPQRPSSCKLVIAAYGSDPSFPGKWAHQYMDNAQTPPFGASDLNSADGLGPLDFQDSLGIRTPPPPPAPKPNPGPPAPASTETKTASGMYRHVTTSPTTLADIAASRNETLPTFWTNLARNLTGADLDEIGKLTLPPGFIYYTAFQ